VKNIILTGGNALFPNYRTRIESEIRQYIPDTWASDVKVGAPLSLSLSAVSLSLCLSLYYLYLSLSLSLYLSVLTSFSSPQVFLPEDPINYAWTGASRFVRDAIATGDTDRHFVTKQEYLERGHNICRQKFLSSC
jgi:actin-related protein